MNLQIRSNINKIRYLNFRPYIDNVDILPSTPNDLGYYFKMLGTECPLIRCTLLDNGFIESNCSTKEWTILFSSVSIKQNIYQNLKKYQKLNHFPRSIEITRKDLLYKNITKMQGNHHIKAYNFVPQSFILPQDYSFLEEVYINIKSNLCR